MKKVNALTTKYIILALSALWLYPPAPAHAYIDLAPTLSRIVNDSVKISVVEVVQYNASTHELTLKEIRALKGDLTTDLLHHQIAADSAASVARPILQWATAGSQGVLFSGRNSALVCVGTGWYQVRGTPGTLQKLAPDRPDLPLAYYGTVSRLIDGVSAMATGKESIITVVSFSEDQEGASFDLALNRQNLPGIVRVERIRANANTPGSVAGVSGNPAFVVGYGVVDEDDIPALIKELTASDPATRARAADDLRTLGRKAAPAADPLTKLLTDTNPSVRCTAASTLLVISPRNTHALDVLTQALKSTDPATTHAAAQAAGFVGPAGTTLVPALAGYLKNSDQSLRVTALQSLCMLGPVASAAVPAVSPLLDDPSFAVDAADALGRIGPAAEPALPRLTQLLSSTDYAVRWAACRAMSQIGTQAAHPAVDFMVAAMPKATEVEGYNMMIYLSLLGPVAQDAAPAIRSFNVKNPVLPSSTMWAINSDKVLPWQFTGGGRGFGGPGGRGGGGGPGDLNTLMFQAYIHELGPRLKPLASMLAQKIIDGTAGTIPEYGYKILNAAPEDSLAILIPHLNDKDLAIRERAAVALGHMAAAAAPAKDKLQLALASATDEKEKRLLQWSLSAIEQE